MASWEEEFENPLTGQLGIVCRSARERAHSGEGKLLILLIEQKSASQMFSRKKKIDKKAEKYFLCFGRFFVFLI